MSARKVCREHAALALADDARHFGATEAASALDLHALSAQAHRALHGLLHRALERNTLSDLLGDALGHQLRIKLRLMDFLNIQLDLLASKLLKLGLEHVDFRAALADHHARLRGEDRDLDLVRRALDLDPRKRLRQQARDRARSMMSSCSCSV